MKKNKEQTTELTHHKMKLNKLPITFWDSPYKSNPQQIYYKLACWLCLQARCIGFHTENSQRIAYICVVLQVLAILYVYCVYCIISCRSVSPQSPRASRPQRIRNEQRQTKIKKLHTIFFDKLI